MRTPIISDQTQVPPTLNTAFAAIAPDAIITPVQPTCCNTLSEENNIESFSENEISKVFIVISPDFAQIIPAK